MKAQLAEAEDRIDHLLRQLGHLVDTFDGFGLVAGELRVGLGERGWRCDRQGEDADGEGWFFKLTLSDPSELEGLMDEAKYDAFVAKL